MNLSIMPMRLSAALQRPWAWWWGPQLLAYRLPDTHNPMSWALVPAGWTQSGAAVVSPRAGAEGRETVTVLHRFHFSSALKRMAALVRVRPSAPVGLGCRPAFEKDSRSFWTHGDCV